MQQAPQTKEELLNLELQKRLEPLKNNVLQKINEELQKINYSESSIFKSVPTLSANQILEHHSGFSLKGMSENDYLNLSEGNLTYHNVRFLWELVGNLTPQQLNISPSTYREVLLEGGDRISKVNQDVLGNDLLLEINEEFMSEKAINEIKVDIEMSFKFLERKNLENRRPVNAVIPTGRR